jgi:hypothetical protein
MDKSNKRKTMNKILTTILVGLFVTACSVKEPRISLGKKCTLKDDKVVYSYLWLYDKQVGLPADKETCEQIAND